MEETPTRLPVNLPDFTGPLDLLVMLIGKHVMDIFSISISTITDDYIKQVRTWEESDLDLAGEYLVLTATLVRYKARALLPKEEVELEEEEIDDRILEERRMEYERFRKLADELRTREEETAAIFPRVGPSPEGKGEVIEFTEISVYDLHRTFQKILDDIGSGEEHVVTGDSFSVDEKMLEIEALIAHNDRIVLTEYLRTLQSKLEVIVVFLALLELIRLREIHAVQEKQHGEIILEKGEKGLPGYADDMDEESNIENESFESP